MADIHDVPDASMMTPVQAMDIQAPMDDLTAVTASAVSTATGPRQEETRQLLESPQGFSAGGGTSGYDITAGWSGEPDESWANDVQMPSLLETPIQGSGDYPGTVQDGLQTYGTG